MYFDIETSGLDPATSDFKCACFSHGEVKHVARSVADAVSYIVGRPANDQFVTWNGAAFDFRFLAEKTECHITRGRLAHIARDRHFDMMLDFLAHYGYPASMESFASRLPGEGKTWSGAGAAEASDEDIEKVIAYCENDVQILRSIHKAGRTNRTLARTTKGGKVHIWPLPRFGAFRDVAKCLEMSNCQMPDQTWMDGRGGSKLNILSMTGWCAAYCAELASGSSQPPCNAAE